MNDVIIAKTQSIQRCVERAREIYSKNKEIFLSDHTTQDAAVMNLIRASELSIDLANLLNRLYKLGIPASSAESFDLIEKKHIITPDLADKLKKMVVFETCPSMKIRPSTTKS